MFGRAIDRLVGLLSPRLGVERLAYRSTLESIDKLMGGPGGYDAARVNRLTALKATLHENAIDTGTLDRLEGQARDLWRNNPHARKIVRQIQTKTLGKGMRPISQATDAAGRPDFAFRKRAKAVWEQFCKQSDYRGLPGRGGQHFGDQARSALAAVVRNGNAMYRMRPLSRAEQRRRGLLLPLALQLVDAGRLDHSLDSFGEPRIFRGIELDADGLVAAYHVLPYHPSDPRGSYHEDSQRIRSADMGHVFVAEDIDQILGVSWFAPALTPMRDTGDYTYAELKAAAMGACVVAGVKQPTGTVGTGLMGAAGSPLVDSNGNPITRLQPGMFFNLGTDGKIEGFNPQRPNTNAAEFIAHLLRTIAVGFPGMKGSSLTGDYRGSSFSSERSADNELWPEIEGLQHWWGCSFQQPIYEAVIITAVLLGLFDDVVQTQLFLEQRSQYLAADWQGPVQKSINPVDDEQASQAGLANRTTSPQIEAAKKGRDALEVLQDVEEYSEQVDQLDVDDELKRMLRLQAIGAMPQAAAAPEGEKPDKPAAGDAEDEADDPDPGSAEEEDDDEGDRRRRFTWPARV